MAKDPSTAATVSADPTAVKVKRTRAPSVAKPIYIVMQVVDENGNSISFNKEHIKVLAFEKSSDAVLALIEGKTNPNAFYVRGFMKEAA